MGAQKCHAVCSLQMSLVAERLYVGGIRETMDETRDGERGVTHVLNVASELNGDHRAERFTRYLHLGVEDDGDDLISVLSDAVEFVHRGIAEGGVVLVHCWSGVSRSVCVAAAYLTAHAAMTIDQALVHVKLGRPSADPWPAYVEQLRQWRTEHFKWK
jgi:protein-tyrosine phosphatase